MKTSWMSRLSAWLLSWSITLAAQAQFSIPGFELVETIPVETSLGVEKDRTRDAVAVWCEMFRSAREEIVLEFFYLADKPGEPFAQVQNCLADAGRRGVKIRFLIDGVSKITDAAAAERLLQIPNLTLRRLDFGTLQPFGIIHAKYLVVDRQQGFVGSHNYDWRAFTHIHETGLRITEPDVVAAMQAIFELDWEAAGAQAEGRIFGRSAIAAVEGPRPASYLVASPKAFNPPGVRDAEAELVRLLANARQEVRILLYDYALTGYGPNNSRPYYDTIDRAVRAAAVRGVKVRLMVSVTNADRYRQPYLKSLAMMPNVEVRLVTIPTASVGPIPYARLTHSKTMSIDGQIAWVGTSNWAGGYLDNSRNLEVVMHSESMAQRLAATHEQMWHSSYAKPLDITKDYAARP